MSNMANKALLSDKFSAALQIRRRARRYVYTWHLEQMLPILEALKCLTTRLFTG